MSSVGPGATMVAIRSVPAAAASIQPNSRRCLAWVSSTPLSPTNSSTLMLYSATSRRKTSAILNSMKPAPVSPITARTPNAAMSAKSSALCRCGPNRVWTSSRSWPRNLVSTDVFARAPIVAGLLVHFLPGLVGIVFGDRARKLRGVRAKVLLNDDAVLVDHECHNSRRAILGGIGQKRESIRHLAID